MQGHTNACMHVRTHTVIIEQSEALHRCFIWYLYTPNTKLSICLPLLYHNLNTNEIGQPVCVPDGHSFPTPSPPNLLTLKSLEDGNRVTEEPDRICLRFFLRKEKGWRKAICSWTRAWKIQEGSLKYPWGGLASFFLCFGSCPAQQSEIPPQEYILVAANFSVLMFAYFAFYPWISIGMGGTWQSFLITQDPSCDILVLCLVRQSISSPFSQALSLLWNSNSMLNKSYFCCFPGARHISIHLYLLFKNELTFSKLGIMAVFIIILFWWLCCLLTPHSVQRIWAPFIPSEAQNGMFFACHSQHANKSPVFLYYDKNEREYWDGG